MTDPRHHQSKREAFRRAVLAMHGPICMMPVCKLPTRTIDLTLPAHHPGSYEADHIETVATLKARGAPLSAYYDPTNGRSAHARCNRAKGAADGNRARGKQRRTDRLNTSRPW